MKIKKYEKNFLWGDCTMEILHKSGENGEKCGENKTIS